MSRMNGESIIGKRDNFASEESYRKWREKEYRRYYTSTQLYKPRKWTDEDEDLLLKHYSLTAMELSPILHRSVKSIEHRKSVLRKRGLVHIDGNCESTELN